MRYFILVLPDFILIVRHFYCDRCRLIGTILPDFILIVADFCIICVAYFTLVVRDFAFCLSDCALFVPDFILSVRYTVCAVFCRLWASFYILSDVFGSV